MSDFSHGGQIYQFAREQNTPIADALAHILDFSASINPIQPDVDWQAIIRHAQIAVQHYPDSQQQVLKEAIGHRFQLPLEQITLTNGISSAIISLFNELKPDTTLLFTPIYSEYRRAAKRYSDNTIEVIHGFEEGLSESLLQQIHGLTENSVAVLVNPNTPQGHYQSPEALEPLLELLRHKNCWVLVDESFLPFIGFSEHYSVRRQLKHHPKMVILQSLTKYYACPGIRIGALFTAAHALDKMTWPSWPLSVLDEQFVLQALTDPRHEGNTRDFLQTERPRFITALSTCDLIESVEDSMTNFVLVRTRIKAYRLVECLASTNILIRDCENFGLGQYTCRIAIQSTENNHQLVQALHQNRWLMTTEPLLSESK
ncbi:pyridoxal phosphate-dependent aminotransferase [Thiomicrorhabdus arctica]|uniref:pyridoxal phosphate-dependent aminotransferase n=1 Tax=Thiomicrorhabdus arctica TaxID=131540 RepID=UPI000370C69E|nr:aminotransferase class I/II-fold pyridoxal phosphate-dependent enzyme [Thiomicrorhabdus arctica]